MFMKWINLFKTRKSLKKALAAEEPSQAIKILNEIFARDDFTTNFKIWKPTWQTLGHIADKIEEKAIANDCYAVSDDWENLQLLYELGYNLVDQKLFQASIPLFERGLNLDPKNEHFLLELVNSYEAIERYDLAKEKLLEAPELLEIAFLPRYLMAFYSIMLLDIQSAKQWFAGLDKLCHCDESQQEAYCHMYEKIKGILERVDVLSPMTSLDAHDTRGWNAALNSNVLLALSDDDISMNGRYGFFQESPKFMFECIAQLKALLSHLKFIPERILTFPDRDSCILAQAASKLMNCPIEEYSEATKTLPGLIVCYNFNSESLTDDIRNHAQEAYENQIFWCHSFDWTKNSLAPDFISYFAQYSIPVWEKRIAVNNTGGKPEVVEIPALEGSYEDVYRKIQTLAGENPEKESCPLLQRLAFDLFCVNEKGSSIFNQKRTRPVQILASPVFSPRFC